MPRSTPALHRHGLPTAGGAGHGDGSLLQLLPLVLALGWAPTDPRRALELLTLPISPIPRTVAWRLVGALQKWPAVDSDAWRSALAEGLAAVEDPERRDTVLARIATFLVGSVRGTAYPAAEARRQVDALSRWLQARAGISMDETVAYGAALSQAGAFQRGLDLSGLDPISALQLGRLVEDASDAAGHTAPHPAQAGCRVPRGPTGSSAPRPTWCGGPSARTPPPPCRACRSPAQRRACSQQWRWRPVRRGRRDGVRGPLASPTPADHAAPGARGPRGGRRRRDRSSAPALGRGGGGDSQGRVRGSVGATGADVVAIADFAGDARAFGATPGVQCSTWNNRATGEGIAVEPRGAD